MQDCRLIVLDRHPLFRRALCDALQPLGVKCLEIASFDHLMAMPDYETAPDLILLDLWQPGLRNATSHNYLRIKCLRSHFRRAHIVAISDLKDKLVIERSIAIGASGYILKSEPASSVRNAVRNVLEGEIHTPYGYEINHCTPSAMAIGHALKKFNGRQAHTLMLICEGRTNRQIGDVLGISEQTVKYYVSAILRNLGVVKRTQAAILIDRLADAELPDSASSGPSTCESLQAEAGFV